MHGCKHTGVCVNVNTKATERLTEQRDRHPVTYMYSYLRWMSSHGPSCIWVLSRDTDSAMVLWMGV